RSLHRLFAIAPGFEPAHVVTMQVQTAGRRFVEDAATHRFFAAALDAVRRVPGVVDAGFTSQLPLSGTRDMYGVHFQSAPTGRQDADSGAFRYAVTAGYAESMRLVLRRGRLLDAHDSAAGAARVAVISDSLAGRKFPGADPIGQRLKIGSDQSWRTIVG